MTARFASKFPALNVVALFITTLSVLAIFATSAIAQNPLPLIHQPLVPDATAPGGAGFSLTVNGAGFVAASTVNWNGSPLATTFVSSSQLTATVPASDIATASTASVTVVNPSPGGGVSNTQFLSIAEPEASVSFLPAVAYNVGDEATEFVAVADVNGDGKPDLVVADQNLCSSCIVSADKGKREDCDTLHDDAHSVRPPITSLYAAQIRAIEKSFRSSQKQSTPK